jgi:hypothetical protein
MEFTAYHKRWRDLVAAILSSSSRVLLNGKPGRAFYHKRGLRKGDPISLMLFILVLGPLQKLFHLASVGNVLSPFDSNVARMRASFYADDAAKFIRPVKEDIFAIQQILKLFGDASGLCTNLHKCVAFPIACGERDMADVLSDFGGVSLNIILSWCDLHT